MTSEIETRVMSSLEHVGSLPTDEMLRHSVGLALALSICFVATVWGRREYRALAGLASTSARTPTYRRWIVRSFGLFLLASVLILALLGGIGSPLDLPDAFSSLRATDGSLVPTSDSGAAGFLVGMVTAALVAGVLVPLVSAAKAADDPNKGILGDVAALLPRTRGDRAWAGLLSLNAGLSEEVFFRLTLPLVLTGILGDPLLAFVLAAVVFGACHAYQGIVGVLGTTLAAVLFSVVYVQSGSLLVAIVLHAAFDVRALVLQPMLYDWARRNVRSIQGFRSGASIG